MVALRLHRSLSTKNKNILMLIVYLLFLFQKTVDFDSLSIDLRRGIIINKFLITENCPRGL